MANPLVCTSCQRSNDPWRRHCGGCGSGLPGGCPLCATVNRADDRFCGGCAHRLRVVSGEAPRKQVAPGTSTIPIDISELLPDLAGE